MNIVEKLESHTQRVSSALSQINDPQVRSSAILQLMEMNALCLQAIKHAADMRKHADQAMALLNEFTENAR